MGFYWTGTGFEERTAPPMPPPPDPAKSEPRQTATFETTQDAAPQDAAKAIEKHFSFQTEIRSAESRKKNDDRGPVSFDPIQGVWMRAEKNAALFPAPAAPPATVAVDSPQTNAPHDAGLFFKWTSWLRTDSEKNRAPITSPPEQAFEAGLQSVTTCEDASEALSSNAAHDVDAAEAEIAVAGEDVSPPAASFTDAQKMAAFEAEIAAGEKGDSVTRLSLADTQDSDAPEGQSEAEGNIATPAPLLEPENNHGGSMWQTATNGREAFSKPPRLAGEAAQPAQDGNASRWFVLQGMLGGAPEPESLEPTGSAPVLEVFSLAGGVGKTSLVATLGRALSARGERVLLVEATPLPSLQYYFGACDSRPGAIRTFRPPASSGDAPIRLATLDTEAPGPNSAAQGSLARDIQRWAEGASRVIVDVGTGSFAAFLGLAKISSVVLVPLVPDVHSVVTAKAIDSFLQRQTGASGSEPAVFYVLNQFDSFLPLHLDVRNVLRERLGERLLPFALERTPAVSEALAEGMTIMDYAPDSRITADFTNLADWLERVLAPAKVDSHGRWSER